MSSNYAGSPTCDSDVDFTAVGSQVRFTPVFSTVCGREGIMDGAKGWTWVKLKDDIIWSKSCHERGFQFNKKKALHTSPSWVIFITLQRAASFGSSWYSQLTEKLSYLKNCSLLGETLTKTTRDHQNGGIHSVWIYIGKIGFQILVSLGNLTCSFSRIQKHHCTIKNKKLMEVNTT